MGGGTVSSGMVFISQLMTICQVLFQKDIYKDIITQPMLSYTLSKFGLKATAFMNNLSVTVLFMASSSI
jgi:hypothetical protein